MKSELELFLEVKDIISDKKTYIDGHLLPHSSIKIEYLYLYPKLFSLIAKLLYSKIAKFGDFDIIYGMESAILPLCSKISSIAKKPLYILRKPKHLKIDSYNYLPLYLKKYGQSKSILIDDSIFTGFTINYALEKFNEREIPYPKLFFIFDFLETIYGGSKLDNNFTEIVKNRFCVIKYEDLLKMCYNKGLIKKSTLNEAMKLCMKNFDYGE